MHIIKTCNRLSIPFIKTLEHSFATARASAASSNTIIEPLYFKSESIISKLFNKYKTNNTLSDLQRTFKDFNRKKFPQIYLNQYNKFVEMCKKRQYRGAQDYLSEDLHQVCLIANLDVQSKSKGSQPSPWSLVKAKQMKIVQGRIHSIHLTALKTSNRWFQLTCQFTPEQGTDAVYHVIERNQSGKLFKIIKMDLI